MGVYFREGNYKAPPPFIPHPVPPFDLLRLSVQREPSEYDRASRARLAFSDVERRWVPWVKGIAWVERLLVYLTNKLGHRIRSWLSGNRGEGIMECHGQESEEVKQLGESDAFIAPEDRAQILRSLKQMHTKAHSQ
jgi:hypothetical protein